MIELLVVIAILALLAGLLLPALTRAKAKGQSVACLNNYRQLQLAWKSYTENHADRLPPNGQGAIHPPRANAPFWWAQGSLDFDPDNLENINADYLVDPKFAQLGAYSQSPVIYRCPSDRSKITVEGRAQSRVRSVSMNVYLGGLRNCLEASVEPFGPQRFSELLSPAQTFVFLDEHPDSISFIHFWVDVQQGPNARLPSFPGYYHSGGANVSFADGHVEWHQWRDARTRLPVRHLHDQSWPPADQPSPNNPDVQWLQDRTVFPE